MSERPQDKLKGPGPAARLLGMKWVRRDEGVAVLRLPWFTPRSFMPEIVTRLREDYRFVWPDAEPRLTVQGRLIRVEWQPTSSEHDDG